MDGQVLDSAPLTISIALAVGVLAQSLARHLRLPGIVLLLAAGVVLGPDLLGWVRPASLGGTLEALVGFAVAVILFEGGMSLNWRRLQRGARSIRRLVTLGAAVTLVGGALSARWILDWDWTRALLFGSLVIVTGPTVITPLLRRIRVTHKVATVLEAEGVLGDAIGAVVAVVALEMAISPSLRSAALGGPTDLLARLGVGIAIGLVGGLLISLLLHRRQVVPEGLENVFTLAMALLVFQMSGALMHESGVVAVTVAGIVVGNRESHALEDLREFKEQLTLLVIGMLFVLLAADTRLEDVRALGWPGVWTVAALMFLVRPANIAVGTWGSDLKLREKAFLAWLAPRGIVAAAVSSLFADSLESAGIPGGGDLRALVFLVIAVTVTVQGLTGGLVARLLGVARRSGEGYVILGAGDLGRAVAAPFKDGGHDVVLLDSNPHACRAAQDQGFRVLHGSGLSESLLMRAGLDGRAGVLAVTPNDELNLLFARVAREHFRVGRVWVTLRKGHLSVTAPMVHKLGARVLFGLPRQADLWSLRLERGLAQVEEWQASAPSELTELIAQLGMLPLLVRRGSSLLPVDEQLKVRQKDVLRVAVFEEARVEAEAWLRAAGWERVEQPSREPPAQ